MEKAIKNAIDNNIKIDSQFIIKNIFSIVYDPYAEILLNHAKKHLKPVHFDEEYQNDLNDLINFDGQNTKDSKAALLFNVLYFNFLFNNF